MQSEQVTETTGAPGATLSSVSALPTENNAAARQQRLAALRAASRVLAASLAPNDARRVESFAADLHEQLATFAGQVHSAGAGLPDIALRNREAASLSDELARLDAALDRLAHSLRVVIDAIPRVQLRALLDGCGNERRDEVIALLEVLLEDESQIARRTDVTLSLVTWASSESRDGHRRVVRDPATLTPGLRAFAERCAARADADLASAEQEFVAAARRWTATPGAAVIDEMDARKAALGVGLFAPRLLRAVVFYEATLANSGAVRHEFEIGPEALEPTARSQASESSSSSAWAAIESSQTELTGSPPARRATAPVSSAPLASTAADPADVRWQIHDAPREVPVAPVEPGKLRGALAVHWKSAAKATGIAALLAFAANVWWGRVGDVRELSKHDLAAISASLVSAYRDHGGADSLFIGTVGPEWLDQSLSQRESDAKKIVEKLQHTGVREVLLYDGARRVAVHHAEGLPLHVGP